MPKEDPDISLAHYGNSAATIGVQTAETRASSGG
jgi:hypothetical protein